MVALPPETLNQMSERLRLYAIVVVEPDNCVSSAIQRVLQPFIYRPAPPKISIPVQQMDAGKLLATEIGGAVGAAIFNQDDLEIFVVASRQS
jgi:hypothetical protein